MIDKIFDLGFKDVFSSLPKEFVTINDALKGKNTIKLVNGIAHQMKSEEIEKLSSNIPIYMWSMVKIPFIIVKTMNVGEYLISGSEWEKRGIWTLIGRESDSLTTVDVEELIKKYRSIIFISLTSSFMQLDE
ncbi:DUF61 family protein [Sulfuracidifex metallicus]|uniref:DUF61 family protein n=1 Tax=Sulfuracidifex metallicus TaxID=47303 RepID=UPI002272E551|nr:DUF61 family protein [Sulfuracidifex metallicus]MCY0849569.1 DUF61 family protein [Sulfuracidifex metallicus]